MELNTILFMGKPGSGKGTQASLIAEKYGFDIYSTGGAFREIAASGSDVGNRLKSELDAGFLMPHWFASFLFQKALLERDFDKGIVFEGVGRKKPEAELFHDVMDWLKRPYKVFYLSVDEDAILERLKKRADEEERADDDPESVKKRFAEFNKFTAEAVEYFRSVGVLVEIDGMQTPEEVHTEVLSHIEK